MNNATRIRLSISTKLIFLIALLLGSAISSIVYLATQQFIKDNIALIQQTNADATSHLANESKLLLTGMGEKAHTAAEYIRTSNSSGLIDFFKKEKSFLGIFYHDLKETAPELKGKELSTTLSLLTQEEIDKTFSNLFSDAAFSAERISAGEIQITSIKLNDGTTAIVYGAPFYQEGEVKTVLSAWFTPEALQSLYGDNGLATTYLTNSQGLILAHTNALKVTERESAADLPIVKNFLEANHGNLVTRYEDPKTKEGKLAAFHRLGLANLGVFSEIPEAKAFEAANRVKYRATLLGLGVLFLAFLIGYFYSNSIVAPLKELSAASEKIGHGDFNIELKPKGHDELAQLGRTFMEMVKGLAERDKVKALFQKFHNKSVTEKLLSGDVKLGGERKEAVVLFTDIRGFTTFSEQLKPEEVVEMINEYFTAMVTVIHSFHGVIDKYVGDAIVAVWGVPETNSNDKANALNACLEMRKKLNILNETRKSKGQKTILIGMGLNYGPLIAGNIGSAERMEYTVIGDTVNTASRIESMTKEIGVDLLVSKTLTENMQDNFIFETSGNMKLKGKKEELELFKVNGTFNFAHEPITIETPYSNFPVRGVSA